ncbi:MAG TPA: hypothetical protein VGO49_09815 [Bradyrhizobium sp.]|jgi:hypothetical protein|nr:hypothetical protein [Bradyrhizobium sp.]
MVDDKPDDIGAQADLDRPKRAPPTLDLDAIEISDETQQGDAANAEDKPGRARSWPLAAIVSSAIVSAIFGAGAAALVVWTMGWPGKAPVPPPQTSTAAIDALTARVASVESKAAAPAPAPQIDNAAIDALAARIAGVESKIAAPVAAPVAPAPDPALAAQLDALEKSVATLRDELGVTGARLQQLAAALEAAKSAPRETPPPPDLSTINERLAQLESAAKTLSAEVAKRNATPADDVPLRRVVAASLLDVSVRAGEPYAAALAAAKPLAANADALKPLDVFAGAGVPNSNVLNRELLALLPKLSPAPETSTTGSGIVDRLQAGAARLVRIERTDAIAGNDRGAIVARATAAALRNDIAEARRELKTLAPADRAAAQAWIDKADARDAALAASRQFAADALAALSKPAQ